jgi:hypothetical protein
MRPTTSSSRRTRQPAARGIRGPIVTAACAGGIGLCLWLLMTTGRSPASAEEPEAPPAAPAPVADALPVPAIVQPPASDPAPVPAKVAETSLAAAKPNPPAAPPPAAAPAAKPPSTLGQLELQVADAARQPLGDGRVFVALTAEAGTADARTWRGLSSFKSATIEAGKVEIAGLAAGEYTFMLTGRGVQPKTGRVFVGAGKTVQQVTVEKRPPGQPGGERGAGRGRGGNRGGANPGGAPGQPGSGDPRGTNPGGATPDDETPRQPRRRRGQ